MAYDENLASEVRTILDDQEGLVEKKMFGGIGFMLFGNICCGVMKSDLILRLGPKKGAKAFAIPA